MKTNFFTEIAKLGNGQISFMITTDNDVLSISLLPIDNTINDKGVKKLKPLSLSASAEELDEYFFSTIAEPIIETKSFITNTSNFLKQKEVAENESQMNKEKKDKVDKKVKELKDLMDKDIVENKSKILMLISEIRIIDKDNNYIKKCQEKLTEKDQKALF